jgi:putative phage-type endonuclease
MILEIEQNTPEWFSWRKKNITATMAPILMEVSPWSDPRQLFLKIVGLLPETEKNAAMARGLELEPVVRDLFNEAYNVKTRAVVMISDEHPGIGASLDGWDEETKTLVEIKCPGAVDHRTAVKGYVPRHYYPQLSHQMIVANVEKCFYVSYRPGDVKEFVVIEVLRDRDYDKLLLDKIRDFQRRIETGDCP